MAHMSKGRTIENERKWQETPSSPSPSPYPYFFLRVQHLVRAVRFEHYHRLRQVQKSLPFCHESIVYNQRNKEVCIESNTMKLIFFFYYVLNHKN